MLRSQLNPMPEYFDRYILKNDDVEMLEAIQISLDELEQLPLDIWKTLGDSVYAPGKWTVRDILQHIIDTDRIFTFRALAAARGETQSLPFYDEDAYADAAKANDRSLEDLIHELKLGRQSLQAMYQSFNEEMLQRQVIGFKGAYSVASIGFILPGHQRWHFAVLEERYYPLVRV